METSILWQLKGCAKCQGDLYLDTSQGDVDLVCLQCGRRLDIRPVQLRLRGLMIR